MIQHGVKRRMVIAVPAWGTYLPVFLGQRHLVLPLAGLHQQLDRLWKMLLDATPATWLTMKQAIPKPEATDKK